MPAFAGMTNFLFAPCSLIGASRWASTGLALHAPCSVQSLEGEPV